MKSIATEYHPEMNAHTAVLDAEPGSIRVTVHVDAYDHLPDMDELFLYHFDTDGNCIEFPFGARVEHVEEKKYVTYDTIGEIHKPPHRVEISHQLDTVDLKKYAFSITYQPLPD
jgi:hypothetical protein